MDWFFLQSLPAMFLEIELVFVVLTVGGMLLLEPWRRTRRARFPDVPEQAAFFGTQIWLAYTLILSLTAVGAWSEYQSAGDKVSKEVAALEVLQRRAVLYPEPMRSKLDERVRSYARAVADGEWPEQRQGKHPSAAKRQMQELLVLVGDFEPTNMADQLSHAETLREMTTASEARRMRIHATAASLPGVVWLVVLVGAALALAGATFFVPVDDRLVHLVLVAIMAAFVGLVVFVTAALDHPFHGSVTPSEEGYRLIATRPFGGQ